MARQAGAAQAAVRPPVHPKDVPVGLVAKIDPTLLGAEFDTGDILAPGPVLTVLRDHINRGTQLDGPMPPSKELAPASKTGRLRRSARICTQVGVYCYHVDAFIEVNGDCIMRKMTIKKRCGATLKGSEIFYVVRYYADGRVELDPPTTVR